jgi:large subunit ribosomal protein L13
MKSFLPKEPENRDWVLVDAAGKPLGRLATGIATVLRGKDKPTFSPQVDTGDFVVVVNAEKVKLTGKKEEKKMYVRYTGYRSGRKLTAASAMRQRHPERMISLAVRGMLPKNKLGQHTLRRLKVYAGGEHPHAAQNPKRIEIA